MTPEHFGALLTLVGVLAETVAVVAILIAVGMPARINVKARTVWGQWVVRPSRELKRLVRPLWPRPQPKTVSHPAALPPLRASGSSSTSLKLTTGPPLPTSFEEVGELLADLRKRSNEHERRLNRQTDELRTKIDRLGRDSAERVDEVDERIKEEARRTLAERTSEGILLAVGIACPGRRRRSRAVQLEPDRLTIGRAAA